MERSDFVHKLILHRECGGYISKERVYIVVFVDAINLELSTEMQHESTL